MKIKMLVTVYSELPFAPLDTVLLAGEIYEATSNKYGAVCGICKNGEALGVKPNEFEFIDAPAWLLEIHSSAKANES